MIVVITTIVTARNGHKNLVADYGVNDETGRNVVLPPEHPRDLGAKYDPNMGEWVIRDDEPSKAREPVRLINYA